MSRNQRLALSTLSGLLLGAAFAPWQTGWLAWFAYVPLLFVVDRSRASESAVAALWAHAVAGLFAGHWVLLHPIGSARLASAAGLGALVILSAIPWFLGARAREWSPRRPFWLSVIATSVVTFEMSHLYLEVGFPWLLLGHTQAKLEPFNQVAAIGGVTGLSLWVMSLNTLLFASFASVGRKRRWALTSTGVLILTSSFFGWLSVASQIGKNGQATRVERDELTALAIQPSIGAQAWAQPDDRSRVDTLIALTRTGLAAAARRPDLIIWPETALPAEAGRRDGE